MEYVGAPGRMASPSGSVSTKACRGSPFGLYTLAVDMTSAAFAFRQCWSRSPVPSAFTRIGLVVVVGPTDGRGEVQHVGEVVGEAVEVAVTEVDDAGGHADRVDLVAGPGNAEARDAPHVVVRREVLGERGRDLAGRAGDEDLLVGQHCAPLGRHIPPLRPAVG